MLAVANSMDESSLERQTICRATVVMLSSHFEGSLRMIAQAISNDLNESYSFAELPTPLKRGFVQDGLIRVDTEAKKLGQVISRVVDLLGTTNVMISDSFFLDRRGNPTVKEVNSIGQYFGVDKVCSWFVGSKMEDVFKNDRAWAAQYAKRLATSTRKNVEAFPYSLHPERYQLRKNSGLGTSLFETFIENFLQRRHDLAHGRGLGTPAKSVREIQDDLRKVQLLIYGFVLVVGNKVSEGRQTPLIIGGTVEEES